VLGLDVVTELVAEVLVDFCDVAAVAGGVVLLTGFVDETEVVLVLFTLTLGGVDVRLVLDVEPFDEARGALVLVAGTVTWRASDEGDVSSQAEATTTARASNNPTYLARVAR
jgi:hypothetical protein